MNKILLISLSIILAPTATIMGSNNQGSTDSFSTSENQEELCGCCKNGGTCRCNPCTCKNCKKCCPA